jgi:DNA-binding NtrC family response regulator
MDGEEILRAMGIGEVYVAYSINDATAAMAQASFDIALLDVNLGDGQSSVKLAEHLVSRGTVVVFASGYNPSEGIVGSLDVPMVVKPFDEHTIRAAFQEAFARRARA